MPCLLTSLLRFIEARSALVAEKKAAEKKKKTAEKKAAEKNAGKRDGAIAFGGKPEGAGTDQSPEIIRRQQKRYVMLSHHVVKGVWWPGVPAPVSIRCHEERPQARASL